MKPELAIEHVRARLEQREQERFALIVALRECDGTIDVLRGHLAEIEVPAQTKEPAEEAPHG